MNALAPAPTNGFDLDSTRWVSRAADVGMSNILALAAKTKHDFTRSKDVTLECRNVEFSTPDIRTRDDLNKLTLVAGGSEMTPTHHSFTQLCGLAGAPGSYLRTLASPIVADALNYGLRANRKSDTVKLYSQDGTLKAATSESYGRIPNFEVAEALLHVVGDGVSRDSKWRVPGHNTQGGFDPFAATDGKKTLLVSDQNMHVQLIDPHRPIVVGKNRDGSDDVVYRGLQVGNSELGAGTLYVRTFLFRGRCENTLYFGSSSFETETIRHTRGAPERWLRLLQPALTAYMEGDGRGIVEAVTNAKAREIAREDEEMVSWLRNRNLSRKQALSVIEAVNREEERPCRTAWDVVQGITAVAREMPFIDDRFEFGRKAEALLVAA